MLTIFVAGKSGRSRFEAGPGRFVLGREPQLNEPHGIIDDRRISGRQLGLEELTELRIRIENLSRQVSIKLLGGLVLTPGQSTEQGLPVRLKVGDTWVDVTHSGTAEERLEGLSSLEETTSGKESVALSECLETSPPVAWLTHWFEEVVAIQRAAATRGDFYRDAARAVVRLVGLDCGIVLLRVAGDWQVIARAGCEEGGGSSISFSRTILDLASRERRTFFRAASLGKAVESLEGVEAVVVSPIVGADEEMVIGAIYGVRLATQSGPSAEIRALEAQLVKILAAAVGSGIARLGAEAEASRRLIQFEQFFSPELARQLEIDPTMLNGRERRITALFSDIRGFSSISEKLPPREVCHLISDVMDRLTFRIREQSGVIVDYVGDGLLAMWNAPEDQPDHALLACRAAQAMIGELAALNERWQGRIDQPLRLGIGLNTGEALVGNTGSQTRFKYGPLGHTVNLASRIEGATKQFGVSILLADSTQAALEGALPTRRLCRVRVVGIANPVDLHQLPDGPTDQNWIARRDAYEVGLARFEAGDLTGACRALYSFVDAYGDRGLDIPTLSLVGRSIEQLKSPDRPFDPVIELNSK